MGVHYKTIDKLFIILTLPLKRMTNSKITFFIFHLEKHGQNGTQGNKDECLMHRNILSSHRTQGAN